MVKVLLLLPLILGFAGAQNLLENGDFEQDLTVGWQWTYGGYGSHLNDRQVWRHPDPDYEAWVQQYDGEGWSKLYQIVDVTDVELDFSFIGKFEIGGSSSTCWPVGSVCIEYYNASQGLLGETRFYCHDAYCNWTPSSTLDLVPVSPSNWEPWNLNIQEELTYNLPGVNSEDVAKIGVAMYLYTSGG